MTWLVQPSLVNELQARRRRRRDQGRGSSEIQVKERKIRVDDALNATRAAVEEGIVPGGGVALLWAAKSLKAKGDNEDEEAGVNIVRRALQAPIRQIAENAGVEGSIVVGKVTDQ